MFHLLKLICCKIVFITVYFLLHCCCCCCCFLWVGEVGSSPMRVACPRLLIQSRSFITLMLMLPMYWYFNFNVMCSSILGSFLRRIVLLHGFFFSSFFLTLFGYCMMTNYMFDILWQDFGDGILYWLITSDLKLQLINLFLGNKGSHCDSRPIKNTSIIAHNLINDTEHTIKWYQW